MQQSVRIGEHWNLSTLPFNFYGFLNLNSSWTTANKHGLQGKRYSSVSRSLNEWKSIRLSAGLSLLAIANINISIYSGKGTPRRKVKKVHKSSGTDDKKLQTSLKKLNVQPIQAIEEVNMFKEDGNVIHFAAPKGKLQSRISNLRFPSLPLPTPSSFIHPLQLLPSTYLG